jgi:hypothetical protein
MATLTPEQRRTRERVETLIRLAAPGLNLVLAAGERISRLVERDDPEYYPVRPQRTESGEPIPPPASPDSTPLAE